MTTPDAAPGRDLLVVESGLEAGDYPETVAARVLLRIGLYSPGRTASSIRCPVLMQIMSEDAVTPADVAKRVAGKIPDVTVHVHEGGHFDPYVQPLFPTIIDEQLAFLTRTVPAQ